MVSTEWTVYHEDLRLAGSIDMVYENPDGSLSIYDWKRSADISKVNSWNKTALTKCISWMPDSNFWHYALQLNTYKMILETKYGKIVKELFLVRLHPDSDNYELIQVPDLKHDITKEWRSQFLELVFTPEPNVRFKGALGRVGSGQGEATLCHNQRYVNNSQR